MRLSADLDPERLAHQPFERRRVPRRRPQLQLRVARGSHLQQPIVSAIVKLDARDRLRVAAVEAFGQAQNRRERADRAAAPPADVPERAMAFFRRGLAVIPRDQRDGLDLVRLEAPQIAVLDQIVRVLVMSLVADVHAHVVEDRRVFEPLALTIGQAVDPARLLEERHGKPRDLRGVLRPVVAPLGKLHDAAPADVGIAIRLRDLFAMPCNVVED
jgi:hypothetical protein